jgi:hypothetical protein
LKKYVQLLARLSGGSMGAEIQRIYQQIAVEFEKAYIPGIVSFSLTHLLNLRGLCKPRGTNQNTITNTTVVLLKN